MRIGRMIAGAWLVLAAAGTPAQDHKHGHGTKIDYAKAKETAYGRAADPKKAARTVSVDMTDEMRFLPAEVTVRQGEVVRFLPRNKGQVMHEMVLGTMDELKKHAELMKKKDGMAHGAAHDMANVAHVAPGKRGELGWQFTRAGEVFYGCLIPGHFDAGMVGKVIVTP